MSSRSAVQPCVVMSDTALQAADLLEPLIGAVAYNRYRPERRFLGATAFMETSLNIVDPHLSAGLDRLGTWTLLAERELSSLACDVGPAALRIDEAPSAGGYPRFRLGGPRLDHDEYFARARENAAWLRRRFPGALRLENLNYFPTADGAYEDVCAPEFIARVTEVVDGELLLDIGHALISSANLGVPITEYMEALPLSRVREVHISACDLVNGTWEDTHGPPGPREWDLLEWLCARAPVRYVTIEYYGDAVLLLASYRELVKRMAPEASSDQ